MKSIVLFLLLALSLNLAAGGKSKSDAIYDQYNGQDGVLAMSFSKTMLDAVDLDVEWKEQMKYVQGDLSQIRMMLLSDNRVEDGSIKKIIRSFKKSGYEEVWIENEGEDENGEPEDDLLLMVKRDGNNVSEVHFISFGSDSIQGVFSIYGDLQVTDDK
ncbi:DUF4252 domain-containing protein [bacterium SCSIO 12741]|nr:DUF4252 domain-containing protein [bacterium SCSIO 12741]